LQESYRRARSTCRHLVVAGDADVRPQTQNAWRKDAFCPSSGDQPLAETCLLWGIEEAMGFGASRMCRSE
jgi:hypothetical protein